MTLSPTVETPTSNISVNNDAGLCSAVVTYTAPTFADNCDGSGLSGTMTAGLASGSAFPVGVTTVTYEYTDAAGNGPVTSSFTVTVSDTESPTVETPTSNISVNNDAGLCSAVVTYTAPTFADNCDGSGLSGTMTAGLASGSAFPVGVTTVTYEYTDAAGNGPVTSSFNVIVTDNEDPHIVCPGDITVTGVCSTVVTYATPAGTDNCPGATTVQTEGLPSGATFPVGITTNTFVVTDAAGRTASCSFTVEVIDDIDPVITCPGNITTNNDPGVCEAVVTYVTPVGTDNCPGATTAQIAGYASGSAFPVGITINTFEVTDASGNTAQCSFVVSVNDGEAPVISGCPTDIGPVPMDAGACGATVTWTDPTATDNCDAVVSVVRTDGSGLNSGDLFPEGVTTISFSSTDSQGNVSTCSFTITVDPDVESPTVDTPTSDISVNNDAGLCSALVTYTAPTFADNCDGSGLAGTMTAGLASGSAFPVGVTTVTYEYTDAAGNGPVTSSFTVTVSDTESPTVDTPTSDISVNNDAGLCSAVVTYTAPTFADNCDGSGLAGTMTAGLASGSAFPVGVTTVTYEYTDAAGNGPVTSSFTVTVSDTESPTVETPTSNISVNNDAGLCSAVVTYTAPTFADNCDGSGLSGTMTAGLASGSAFPVGVTTVTYEYTDAAGNGPVTSSFTVTVSDTESPTVDTPTSDISVNNDAGLCSALVTYTAPTFADNCDGSGLAGTMTAGLASGSAFPVGVTTVTYEYTDAAGNGPVTSSFTVTVSDTESPTVDTPTSDISVNNDAGLCSAVVTYTAPTFADNCDGSGLAGTMTAGLASGSAFPVGVTTVTYEYTDAAGNGPVTSSFTVTVSDTESPTVETPTSNISVNNDAGLCSAVVTYTAPTFADNCDGSGLAGTMTAGLASGSAFPVGVTTVTYEYTDAAGNGPVTSSFTVTVSDTESPTVDTPTSDISVNNDAGLCSAVVTYTAPTFADNCDGSGLSGTMTAGLASGSAFPVGVTTVTYEYTDAAGNGPVTSSFTVTVSDTESPTVETPTSNISVNNDAGLCSAVVTYTAPTFADNCDGSGLSGTMTAGLASGSAFPVGVTTVTYEYTDAAGNPLSSSFDVVVVDTEAPVITVCASDRTISADSNCEVVMPDLTGEVTATDNCAGITVTQVPVAGTVISTGITPVTLTVTDAGGNMVDCNANVIVVDDTDPVLVTVDTTVYIGTGNIVVIDSSYVWYEPASSDNCGISLVSLDNDTFDCSMLGVNTVTVTAYDASGNNTSLTATVTVEDTTTVVADAGSDAAICITEGSYTVTDADVVNGTVMWGTTGDGTFDDPTLVNPVYTLGITDSDSVKLYMDVTPITGCTAVSDTMKLTINNVPVAEAGDDIDICTGTTDVSITTASYDYGTIVWTSSGDGSFDDNTIIDPVYTLGISDIDSVKLTLTVTGAGSCGTAVDSMKIRVFDAPVADAGADDAVCASVTSYTVTGASSSDGTVLWTGSGDGTFSDPSADNPVYTFGPADYSAGSVTLTMTVTGVGACGNATDDKIISINDLPSIIVNEHTDISCNGLTDGVLRISGSGSMSPYQYSINGGAFQASGDFTGLSDGDYDLIVLDAKGCSKDTTITITEPDLFEFTLDMVTHNNCYGSDNASINITVSGGTQPYAISWTGPDGFTSTDEDITGLAAGLYSLSLTDANSCNVFTLDTTITEPPQLIITPVDTSDYNSYGVSCYGATDGYIEVDISGGTGILAISWEGPGGFSSADEDIADLQAGAYILTVTDELGCYATYDVTLTEPAELTFTYSVTDASCPGVEDGTIDLTISGGVTPYTILWNDGETTEDRNAASDGDYTVEITDANGCTEQALITVGVIGINCVVVPEVITPGEVDGKNDVLIIRHIGLYPNAEIKIFTRWGKLIYSAKNLEENQWDGTFKGKALPVDSYHYILDLGDGSTPKTGTITIIR